MVTCTPQYGLPIVEGTDRPCDYDDTSCAFAEAVEAELDALDAVVARTATTIPVGWVRASAPFTVTQNTTTNVFANPPFDTVMMDTGNMVDLDSFNGVTVRQAGLYIAWIYGRGQATVVGGTDTNASYTVIADPIANISNSFLPRLLFTQVQLNQFQRQTFSTVISVPADTRFVPQIQPLGIAGDAITYAQFDFGLIWVGDRP
jgi:hypothetical protein